MTLQSKEDVTALILSAKRQTGMTWEEIAGKIGMSPVWTHSACVGMNAMPPAKNAGLKGAPWSTPSSAPSSHHVPSAVWYQ